MTELGHLLETFCVGEVLKGERAREADFRSLRKLREALGARFLGGLVLHLGRHAYTHDERLHALPVDRLWQAG